MKEPSEMFIAAFHSRSGGIVRTCTCGITYFDYSSPNYYDEGELEELKKNQAANPEKYIAEYGSISTMTTNNLEYVIDCKCGMARKYEDFIIRDSRKIVDYLNARSKMLMEEAKSLQIGV